MKPTKAIAWSSRFLLAGALLVSFAAAVALDRIAGSLHSEWPRPLWLVAEFTTHIGEAHWVLVPTGLVVATAWFLYWRKGRQTPGQPSRLVRVCAFVFACAASAEVGATLLKVLFGRARPQLMDSVGPFALNPLSFNPSHLSFPSAHAAAVAATCMAVALLWPSTRFLALAAAVWLGMTRIFVGAHYPSDVVAGLALGAYVSIVLAGLSERKGWLSFRRRDSGIAGNAALPPDTTPERQP